MNTIINRPTTDQDRMSTLRGFIMGMRQGFGSILYSEAKLDMVSNAIAMMERSMTNPNNIANIILSRQVADELIVDLLRELGTGFDRMDQAQAEGIAAQMGLTESRARVIEFTPLAKVA